MIGQSWFDAGQSRESGGRTAESTDYATSATDPDRDPNTGS